MYIIKVKEILFKITNHVLNLNQTYIREKIFALFTVKHCSRGMSAGVIIYGNLDLLRIKKFFLFFSQYFYVFFKFIKNFKRTKKKLNFDKHVYQCFFLLPKQKFRLFIFSERNGSDDGWNVPLVFVPHQFFFLKCYRAGTSIRDTRVLLKLELS